MDDRVIRIWEVSSRDERRYSRASVKESEHRFAFLRVWLVQLETGLVVDEHAVRDLFEVLAFTVREWLAMLDEASERAAQEYFAKRAKFQWDARHATGRCHVFSRRPRSLLAEFRGTLVVGVR